MQKLVVALYEKKELFRKIFFAILAAVVVFDIVAPRHHPHFIGDKIPGFWSVWGLVICLAMIVIWKGVAHTFLEREEDYYDN